MPSDPPFNSLVCCRCRDLPPDNWYPHIGAICWECALQQWLQQALTEEAER